MKWSAMETQYFGLRGIEYEIYIQNVFKLFFQTEWEWNVVTDSGIVEMEREKNGLGCSLLKMEH